MEKEKNTARPGRPVSGAGKRIKFVVTFTPEEGKDVLAYIDSFGCSDLRSVPLRAPILAAVKQWRKSLAA
jgi:hypothetical protein